MRKQNWRLHWGWVFIVLEFFFYIHPFFINNSFIYYFAFVFFLSLGLMPFYFHLKTLIKRISGFSNFEISCFSFFGEIRNLMCTQSRIVVYTIFVFVKKKLSMYATWDTSDPRKREQPFNSLYTSIFWRLSASLLVLGWILGLSLLSKLTVEVFILSVLENHHR